MAYFAMQITNPPLSFPASRIVLYSRPAPIGHTDNHHQKPRRKKGIK